MNSEVPDDDIGKFETLLKDFKTGLNDISGSVKKLITRVEEGEFNTSKGVSFLEVKNELMLSYLTNLSHMMYNKLSGKSINTGCPIDRLIELRVTLDKMKPIDQKLQYQVDKMIRAASIGATDANDPLRYRANPDNLTSKLSEESEESEDDGDKQNTDAKPKLYRPPKLAPMHYEEADGAVAREQKRTERDMRRALSSSIIRDLRDEHSDAPAEIRDTADLHRVRVDNAGRERTNYEETYFMRMTLSKKELAAQRRLRTMGALDGIADFDNSSALLTGQKAASSKTKKRKRLGSKGSKKKSKKRRFK